MTDGVQIEFGRMDQLVAVISDATHSITSDLGQLDRTVAQLGNEWSGVASEAYQKAHLEWAQSLTEMNRILAQVSSTTATITQRHRDTEAKIEALWG
jgi:WXG100 family type VII secretion target